MCTDHLLSLLQQFSTPAQDGVPLLSSSSSRAHNVDVEFLRARQLAHVVSILATLHTTGDSGSKSRRLSVGLKVLIQVIVSEHGSLSSHVFILQRVTESITAAEQATPDLSSQHTQLSFALRWALMILTNQQASTDRLLQQFQETSSIRATFSKDTHLLELLNPDWRVDVCCIKWTGATSPQQAFAFEVTPMTAGSIRIGVIQKDVPFAVKDHFTEFFL